MCIPQTGNPNNRMISRLIVRRVRLVKPKPKPCPECGEFAMWMLGIGPGFSMGYTLGHMSQ